jgi:hypothetical protein
MTIPATNFAFSFNYTCWAQLGNAAPTSQIVTQVIRRKNVSVTVKNTAQMKKRRQGLAVWLPPLPYSASHERDELRPMRTYSTFTPPTPQRYRWGYCNCEIPLSPVTTAMLNDAAELAEIRALSKLKNQNVNFAEFFGEAAQTAKLFGDTAKSVATALRNVKKGNVVGALKALSFGSGNRQRRKAAAAVKREAKAISSRLGSQFLGPRSSDEQSKKLAGTWLALQMAWGPLLSDVDGAAKLLAERSTQDPKRTRFSVRAMITHSVKSSSKSGGPLVVYKDTGGKYGALVRLDFYFSQACIASANADGLTNPASVAWELTPFTFLTDYFVNIGGYISNLDSSLGKEFVGGSVTRFQEWTSEIVKIYDESTALHGTEGSRIRSLKAMQRSVYSGFPDASMHTVQIRNPLKNRKRLANTIAVLRLAVDEFLH